MSTTEMNNKQNPSSAGVVTKQELLRRLDSMRAREKSAGIDLSIDKAQIKRHIKDARWFLVYRQILRVAARHTTATGDHFWEKYLFICDHHSRDLAEILYSSHGFDTACHVSTYWPVILSKVMHSVWWETSLLSTAVLSTHERSCTVARWEERAMIVRGHTYWQVTVSSLFKTMALWKNTFWAQS